MGIYSGNDVHSLDDLITVLSVFIGTGGVSTTSLQNLTISIDILNGLFHFLVLVLGRWEKFVMLLKIRSLLRIRIGLIICCGLNKLILLEIQSYSMVKLFRSMYHYAEVQVQIH